MTDIIVKEHKHGLSVAHPRCDKCGKFFDSMMHKVYKYQNMGVHFNELAYFCRPCDNRLDVPKDQIDLLNKYSEPSMQSYQNILWQSPPRLKLERKGETFFPV